MRNYTGKTYGSVRVIGPTEERRNGYIIWECRCDCGKEMFLESRTLARGELKSCGCRRTVTDLVGQKFGKLTVVSRAEGHSSNGDLQWNCICECGNTTLVTTGNLRNGNKKSCGCLRKPVRKQYEGMRFAMLTVESYAGKEKGCHLWNCRCDCGKTLTVRQSNLQNGHTKSCGCKMNIRKNIHFVDGTSVEAIQSRAMFANNTSGVRGVYWSKTRKRWNAQITFRGKTRYLGSFETLEEAKTAREEAEKNLFGTFLDQYYGSEETAGNQN